MPARYLVFLQVHGKRSLSSTTYLPSPSSTTRFGSATIKLVYSTLILVFFSNVRSQIVEKDPLQPNGPPQMSLVEIGPRFVLTPIRIFEGAFNGATVYSNPGQSSSVCDTKMLFLMSCVYYRIHFPGGSALSNKTREGLEVRQPEGGRAGAEPSQREQDAPGKRAGRLENLCIIMFQTVCYGFYMNVI
jgi:hypothetical protein